MRKTSGGSKFLFSLGMAIAMALAMQPTLSAQETTGGIEAYVKDGSGGAVAKAAVELSGPSLLVPRQLEADEAGYIHFAQVPPGEYKLTVTAPNFQTYQVTGITGTLAVHISHWGVPVHVTAPAHATPAHAFEKLRTGTNYQTFAAWRRQASTKLGAFLYAPRARPLPGFRRRDRG